jgi:hypothetical protein
VCEVHTVAADDDVTARRRFRDCAVAVGYAEISEREDQVGAL